jgi:hypothetical protein
MEETTHAYKILVGKPQGRSEGVNWISLFWTGFSGGLL